MRTKQRAAVLLALGDSGAERFKSAQEIYNDLQGSGLTVGLTTVYRALQSLTEEGAIDAVRLDDGQTVYRRCQRKDHHHHLVCRSCDATVELPADEVEAWAAKVVKKYGFSDVDHTAELFGTCANCRRRGTA